MAILFTLSAYATPPEINGALVKKFTQAFPGAQSIKWYETETFYQVSFKDNDIRCSIYYDKDGNISRTLRYYEEAKLSPFITLKVKEQYLNKKIKGVVEMQDSDGLVYEIIMQDAKHLYIINSDANGNMHLKDKLNKVG